MIAAASMSIGATRPPAVAGAFYTDHPDRLRAEVEAFLVASAGRPSARALVMPHAGYSYSGAVAGKAFAALDGTAVRRVILLGPSHHESFEGGALPARNITAFGTPLGEVPLDMKAIATLRGNADFRGPADSHNSEHSLEVELPFLQVVVPEAEIVPILVGHATDLEVAQRMARALVPLLDEETIVVASSDFTHHGARYRWTPFDGPTSVDSSCGSAASPRVDWPTPIRRASGIRLR